MDVSTFQLVIASNTSKSIITIINIVIDIKSSMMYGFQF